MLLALSNVTYVLIGWFKCLLLKFLYEYGPRCSFAAHLHQVCCINKLYYESLCVHDTCFDMTSLLLFKSVMENGGF